MTPVDVMAAVEVVRAGGVLAYPTEAVFGLGCDPTRVNAIERILALKSRDSDKGLILIASSREQLKPWLAPLKPEWRAKMDAAWPGPVSLVVPVSAHAPAIIHGKWPTIAVRVTAHPVVRALCDACGHALISTSANRAGKEPARSADEVNAVFGDQIDAIVEGETGERSEPSAIIDVRTGTRLRG